MLGATSLESLGKQMKLSLAPFYQFFAPQEGFAEAIVFISLSAIIILAFMGRLTDAFATALTAVGGLGVVHDNCSVWLARKLGDPNDRDRNN